MRGFVYCIVCVLSLTLFIQRGSALTQRAESVCEKEHRLSYLKPCNIVPFIPRCDSRTRTFLRKQCHGRWCYCSSENGTPLKNYKGLRNISCNMDCNCAYDESKGGRDLDCLPNGNYRPIDSKCQKELLALTVGDIARGAIPACASDGKYEPRQCDHRTCRCADPESGEVITPYSLLTSKSAGMTCECAVKKHLAVGHYKERYICAKNGNTLPPCTNHNKLLTPNIRTCDADGYYARNECDENTKRCTCMDPKEGTRVGRYEYDNSMFRLPSDCQCALDTAILIKHGQDNNVECKPDGSYATCDEEYLRLSKTIPSLLHHALPLCTCSGEYAPTQCGLRWYEINGYM